MQILILVVLLIDIICPSLALLGFLLSQVIFSPYLFVIRDVVLILSLPKFYDIGLTLRSEEIGAAAEAWPVGIFGLV